jgi:hypothetical protein
MTSCRALRLWLFVVVLFCTEAGQLYDRAWLNLGMIGLLKGDTNWTTVPASVAPSVGSRLSEVRGILAVTRPRTPDELRLEAADSLAGLQATRASLAEACSAAQRGFSSLQPFLIAGSSRAAAGLRGTPTGATFVGLGVVAREGRDADLALILWWRTQQGWSGTHVALALPAAVDIVCEAKELVGVRAAFDVLTTDPRFTRSVTSSLAPRASKVQLADWRSLSTSGVGDCDAKYRVSSGAGESWITLESGCPMITRPFATKPSDLFVLATRFRTSNTARGTIGVWYNNNEGDGVGGRTNGQWETQVLLFPPPATLPEGSGRLIMGVFDDGSMDCSLVLGLRLRFGAGGR